MAKQVIHSEYFTPVARGNRKSCSNCYAPLNGEQIYSWFEYHNVRRYHIKDCCSICFEKEIKPALIQHAKDCPKKCTFELRVKDVSVLPSWLYIGGMSTVKW